MELGKIYFYTATITKWRNLLESEKYKLLILSSLQYLVKSGKIAVYGYVIMPNHIHLIWELLEINGKEYPNASFMKYTSHLIQKDLRINHPKLLEEYKVDLETRKYHFW
jgi:putative transposase